MKSLPDNMSPELQSLLKGIDPLDCEALASRCTAIADNSELPYDLRREAIRWRWDYTIAHNKGVQAARQGWADMGVTLH